MDITLFFWIENVERSVAIFSIKSLFISQNLGSYNLFYKSIYLAIISNLNIVVQVSSNILS